MASYSGTFIVIDALDECNISDGSCREFLAAIFNLQVKTGTSLFATSRFIPDITEEFRGSPALEIRAGDGDVRISGPPYVTATTIRITESCSARGN